MHAVTQSLICLGETVYKIFSVDPDDAILDLKDRLIGTQQAKDTEKEQYEMKLQQLRNEFQNMKDQLTSENMILGWDLLLHVYSPSFFGNTHWTRKLWFQINIMLSRSWNGRNHFVLKTQEWNVLLMDAVLKQKENL